MLFIDSARTERSTAADHVLPSDGEDTMTRRLDDGREFQIIKRFYDPAGLTERAARSWAGAPRWARRLSSSSTAPPNREPRP